MKIKLKELKTLKDLHIFFSRRLKLEQDFRKYQRKDRIGNTIIADTPMNVIGWFCSQRDTEIKNEAIKHLKYNRQVAKTQWACEPWIMNFFNIKEEELKDSSSKTYSATKGDKNE